jgi:hypothetical protein
MPMDQHARSTLRALLDHHGLPRARSALTLRLILAAFGLVVCVAGAIAMLLAGAPYGVTAAFVVLAMIAAADLVIVARRKHRGEPG